MFVAVVVLVGRVPAAALSLRTAAAGYRWMLALRPLHHLSLLECLKVLAQKSPLALLELDPLDPLTLSELALMVWAVVDFASYLIRTNNSVVSWQVVAQNKLLLHCTEHLYC